MPLSRVKTCDHCRAAKARCSRELPSCSRCAARLLSCTYKNKQVLQQRPNATHGTELSGGLLGDNEDLANPMLGYFESQPPEAGLANQTETAGVYGTNYWPFATTTTTPPPPPPQESSNAIILNEDILNSVNNNVEETTQVNLESSHNVVEGLSSPFSQTSPNSRFFRSFQEQVRYSPSLDGQGYVQSPRVRPSPPDDIGLDSTPKSSTDPLAEMRMIPNFAYWRKMSCLRQRNAATVEPYLIGRILKGQLCSYPNMMIDGGRLPPFIFPRCRFDKREELCVSHGAHNCLPESLSVCICIVKMYSLKKTNAGDFIWRTICSEQEKLCREVSMGSSSTHTLFFFFFF